MHRRDFLHPRQLARTAGQILAPFQDADKPPTRDDLPLLSFAREAMATRFEVLLPFGTPNAVGMAEAALDEIDALEDQLTVFRSHSEVSRLNERAGRGPVAVKDRLFELLASCGRISQETEGAFDVTTGALTRAWGFYRRQGQVPTQAERAEVQDRVGMQHVVLDPEKRTVHYQKPGLEINLGSIGKGYALDRVAGLLRDDWRQPAALLHGGHSSIFALGSPPGDDRGWNVRIRHPWKKNRHLTAVRLRNQGLGTSAATFQHLEFEGRKLGHILDPRTGWPAEGMASATVVAPTAALADALATAFFILGVDKARLYCDNHPEIGALLLPAGENPQMVVLGLTPDKLTPGDP